MIIKQNITEGNRANVKVFYCFIHYVCIQCDENCQMKVFKVYFNDTVTL